MNSRILSRTIVAVSSLCAFTTFAASQMSKTDEGIVVFVDSGETKTWSDLYPEDGLDCAGQKLIKTGAGTFDVGGSGPLDAGIAGVEIREGRYQGSADSEFGVAKGAVSVKNGATLILDGGENNIPNRTVTLAGAGSSREYPALRVEASSHWNKFNTMSISLAADATVYTAVKAEISLFRYTEVKSSGHTLTLDGVEGSGYRFSSGTRWSSAGGLSLADGLTLSAANATSTGAWWEYIYNYGGAPLFTFGENASFKPDTAAVFALVRRASFGVGGKIEPKAGASVVCSLDELTGTPSVSADAQELIVSNSFKVAQADLLAERKLTVVGALTFGDACVVSVQGFGIDLIKLASGAEVTIATAASITGTPALDPLTAQYFEIENAGTALKLVRKSYSGDIVLLGQDWGCLPGSENAAANASAVRENLSKLSNDSVLLVESGDYWFDGGFDLMSLTASGVAVRSLDSAHPAKVHSSVKVGAAENLALEFIVISGTTGPAVIANGTQGLTIRDCILSGVIGTWTDGKAYPYSFTDVEDLLVTGCSHSDAVSPAWSASAYLSGGNQLSLSEVQEGAFVVNVGAGISKKWAAVVTASGLADGALDGLCLIKIGAGELYPSWESAALMGAGISNVIVRCGRYVADGDGEFGVAGGFVHVEEGATLVLKGTWHNVHSRNIELAGSGSSSEYPAVRIENYYSGKCDGVNWTLKSNVAFYNALPMPAGSDEKVFCDMFKYSNVYANGYTLTLDGVTGSSYRFITGTYWFGGGKVVVGSGVRLLSDAQGTSGWWKFGVQSGPDPEFIFKRGSSFEPLNADIFNLVKKMSFEESTALTPGGSTDIAVKELAGAPTLGVNVNSLTVNDLYTVHKTDVLAGRYLDCPGTLAFGANAKVGADDATDLEDKIAFHAAGGVTGSPKRTDDLKAAHIRVARRDACTWAFQGCGLILMVR